MMKKTKFLISLILAFLYAYTNAQYCTVGCNNNTYINSSEPNTIEYDNLVSTFHSSLVKENDGIFKIWGEASASDGISHLLSPTIISNVNGFNYAGTPLKVTGGSSSNVIGGMAQFALLSTEGLYVWGGVGSLISSSIINTTNFSKVNIGTLGITNIANPSYSKGLPYGVEPTNVKMMFGSYKTLAIVTCTGEAWILSTNGSKNGDGTIQGSGTNDYVWHRVKTSESGNPYLTDVVALRGTSKALFALTSTGKTYTWGTGTYINSGATSDRAYATEVTLPSNTIPKMIGMTQGNIVYKYQTYYLLATNGKLYAMGSNQNKQLGDGTYTESTIWKEVTASNTIGGITYNLGGNIAWISPNEHDERGEGTINVLTTDKKQWAWGSNNGYMIGGTSQISYDPMYMPGNSTNANGLNINDNVIAVETGGHTTINIKECSNYFGYVGHKIFGSMGDGTNNIGNPNTFSYATALLVVCGTDVLSPKVVNNYKICFGTNANLDNANLEIPLSQIEWHTGNTRTSSLVTNPNAVSAGTYYAFFTNSLGKCQDTFSTVIVSYLQPGDAGYDNCSSFVCPPDPYAAQQTWWLPYRWPSGSAVKIDFQSGAAVLNNPVAGTFGQGSTTAFEGNVAVTNPISGALLFVTDGNKVYRGSDGLVATGPVVGGSDTAGESAAVIPDPNGILGRNFLIIGNSAANTAGSLRIAKYDVQTNTVSNVTTLLSGNINEALEVIPHTNGTDYWILVHTADENVKSYLYSKASGFNSTPVSITSVPNLTGVSSTIIATGTFISWDPRNPALVLIARHNKIGLASFNPSTGALGTWNVKITTSTGVPDTDRATGYSAALSANGKYIYYVAGGSNIVRYYDLTNGNTYSIGQVGSIGYGLKIAKDGRLYIVGYPNSDTGLYYFSTPDTPPTNNPTAVLPVFNTGGRGVSLQLPNNVYWGCVTCQSGTSAPALVSTTITSNPATVGDLIALLSASNMPTGTVFTVHSGSTATDANKLSNSTAIVQGTTYYVAFYDGLALCYSPTTAVIVNSSTLTEVTCSNNGTFENSTDDFLQFKITPATTSNYSVTATYGGSPVTITQLDNSAATNIMGGLPSYFKVSNGTLAVGGTFTITLTPVSGSVETLTFTNTGTCSTTCTSASSGNTVTYYYYAPVIGQQDSVIEPALLPKFDQSNGRLLTNVSIEYGANYMGGVIIESKAATSQLTSYQESSINTFNISGYTLNRTVSLFNSGLVTIPVGISVPAQGSWLGDVNGRTMERMSISPDANWLNNMLLFGQNPTTSANWVTNVTGNQTHDDDMIILNNSFIPSTNTVNYSAQADLNNFIGTGNLSSSFSNMVSTSLAGSANLTFGQRLARSYFYKITYTYECGLVPAACYKPAVLDAGNTYPTKHGITSLGRAGTDSDNWPMVRQSAWTALEAKTKGFVVNRVKFNTSNQPVADDRTTLVITSPVEGMMVYDTTNNCLKVYTSNDGGSSFAWHCMSTQACPQ